MHAYFFNCSLFLTAVIALLHLELSALVEPVLLVSYFACMLVHLSRLTSCVTRIDDNYCSYVLSNL